MTFTPEQRAALEAPLDCKHVATLKDKKGGDGKPLAYIEAWHAIAEANRIFGFDAWSRETVEMRETFDGERNGKAVATYLAKVRVTVWTETREIVREGTGYGTGFGHDRHESATKEAESDAMKRCLMTFGNPFGLALYDKSRANVTEHAQASEPTKRTSARKLKGAEAWERIVATIDVLETIDDTDTWLRDYEEGRLEADHIPSWDELPDKWREQVRNQIILRREAIAEGEFNRLSAA